MGLHGFLRVGAISALSVTAVFAAHGANGKSSSRLLSALAAAVQAGDGASTMSADLLGKIKAKTEEIHSELIEIRRHIHMHPEVSGEEKETSALVAGRLRELGLDVQTNVGGFGVVAVLRGGKPGPVIAYRADMDAVPSPVVGDVAYKSRVPGVKHVCGHDAHIAVGLGIAEVLQSMRDDVPGTIKFIFQPAEENVTGARAMIAAGVLEDPAPESIFGVHTAPLPVGTIGCPPGVGLTGGHSFSVTLQGDEDELDSAQRDVVASLLAISTVPQIRNPAELAPLLTAIGVENGPLSEFIYVLARNGESSEKIQRTVVGQVRASGPPACSKGKRQVEEAVAELFKHRDIQAETRFEPQRFPDMHSDPDLVHAAIPAIKAAVGENAVQMIYASVPYFGEDFALFQEHIPGAMFFLGAANPQKGITAFNHSPDYDLDEDALAVGTKAMAAVLLHYLQTHGK